MWDPKSNYPGTNDPIIYPTTIGIKDNKRQLVKVHSPNNSNWMGYEEVYLREPTEEELKTLTWPEPRLV